MWCKNCNIETNEDMCPICGETTVEDIPVEVYWCEECKIPIVQNVSQADKGICPVCGNQTKYMAADLRPVFPEERLLLELLLGKKPYDYIEKSVWSANSRYYIDGESVVISSKTFQTADTDYLIKEIEKYKLENSYEAFNKHISNFILANKSRLDYLKDEAFDFVRKTASEFEEEKNCGVFFGWKGFYCYSRHCC